MTEKKELNIVYYGGSVMVDGVKAECKDDTMRNVSILQLVVDRLGISKKARTDDISSVLFISRGKIGYFEDRQMSIADMRDIL